MGEGTRSDEAVPDGQPAKELPRPRKARKERGSSGVSPTPQASVPPELEAEADRLLADRTELYSVLKKNLLVHYLLEAQAGSDNTVNPQHSRASRKQAKELAELLARLTANDPTSKE